MEHNSRTFDLAPLAELTKSDSRALHALALFFLTLGLGLSGFGIYLLVTHLGNVSVAVVASDSVLVAVGLMVTGVSWRYATEKRELPTQLSVSSTGIMMHFAQGQRHTTRALAWSDAGLHLTIYDRRDLPAIRRDGRKRTVFALTPEGGPWIPIPQEAFDAILHRAEENRLRVSHRKVKAIVPGTVDIVSIENR